MAHPEDTEEPAEKQAPINAKPLTLSDYEMWLYALLSANIGRRVKVIGFKGTATIISLEYVVTDGGDYAPRATFSDNRGYRFSSRLANVSIAPLALMDGGEM